MTVFSSAIALSIVTGLLGILFGFALAASTAWVNAGSAPVL